MAKMTDVLDEARPFFGRRLLGAPILRRLMLIGPATITIVVFMIGPLALMAWVSFLERGTNGGVDWERHSTEAYVSFFFERDLDDTLSINYDYIEIFARSILQSISTTLLCVIIGFPTALYIGLQPKSRRLLLMFLVTIPFWTNLLIRNYAWIILLRTNGLIDTWLQSIGLTERPLDLLYTDFAIAVGLTYSFLPFMVLPIYTSIEKLDWRLVEAAYDLGANRLQVLWRIIIPLGFPGIMAGSVLVFIPSLGAFVTPVLLGGGKSLMIGNLIQMQFGSSRNWPFGAALGFGLLFLVAVTMIAYLVLFRSRRAQP